MLISNILGMNFRRLIVFSMTLAATLTAPTLTTTEMDEIEVHEQEVSRVVEVSTHQTPNRAKSKFKFVSIDGAEAIPFPAKNHILLEQSVSEEPEPIEEEPEVEVLEIEPIVEEIKEPTEVTSEPLAGKALYESYVDEICELYQNVPPSIIKAMIERESNWDPNCCSDGGESCGLMQIQPRWHADMMASLGVEDIFDPYGNILVGVNLFSGLLKEYPAVEWALMCYNAGPYYGTLNYRNGQISSYAASIIARAEEIEGGG